MKFSRVFIVDDDKIFHFIIRKMLEKHNVNADLSFFENGLEALNQIKSQMDDCSSLPDLIFLDINMPVLDGWQFLEEYKNVKGMLKGKQPIIYLISSSDNSADRDRAQEYKEEIREYFLKPVGQIEIDKIFLN